MAGRSFKILFSSVYNPVTISRRGLGRHFRRQSIELKKRQDEYFKNMTEEEYNDLHRRSKFLEWNYSAEVFAFGKRLQEEFTPELLVQAFTHKSYIIQEELKQKEVGIESPTVSIKHNSNLVTEGEKVISQYVPKYMSYFLPRFPLEGIESIKNYLTSDNLLADVSKNLGTTFLILSGDYPVEVKTYSNTLKAIIGALNECQGLDRAKLFVRDFIITQMAGKDVNDFLSIENSLEVLSQILERDKKSAPEPRLICQSAVNTILANYHVGIYSNKILIGHSSGESVDIAIEMAAFDALKRLFHTTDSCSPISYDLVEVPETVKNLQLSEWSSSVFDKQQLLSNSKN